MIGPVSSTGRAMMASLQQAIQKGMPPDQAIQYVKSMATQGVAPLTDLYAMMNQFQRLKQQQVQAPQTPPTIRDQLNMAEMQQRQQQMAMQQGLGGMPAPVMDNAQFAGGGIVAFAEGSKDPVSSKSDWTPAEEAELAKLEALARAGSEPMPGVVGSPFGGIAPAVRSSSLVGLQTAYESRLNMLRSKKAAALEQIKEARKQQDIAAEAQRRGLPVPPSVKPPAAAPPAPPAPPPAPPAPPAPRVVAPRVAAATAAPAVAAPKMPSVADFEQQLQERNKPFTEATERYRSFLQGEAASSKEEAKRDRMLALAQAGFAMAQEGSKPGATFLGSAGAAGGDFVKNMMQLNREAAVARRNMQKEMLALDQAKAANDVNMYNVAYQNYTKDRDFVTQVDQFNQGMRLQQAKLALERVLGTGQIQASMANAAATLGLRQEELAARIENNKTQLALQVEQLVAENMKPLKLTREWLEGTPEQRAAIEANVRNSVSQNVVLNNIGTMGGAPAGGATSSLVSAADKIVGIGGTR